MGRANAAGSRTGKVAELPPVCRPLFLSLDSEILLTLYVNVSSLSETREALPTQRVVSMSALLLLVLFFAPYQFAFLVIFVVHLFSTIRSLLLAQAPTGPSTKMLWDRYHYNFVVLLVMLTLLPMNAMILVVWVRNLAVGWLVPFSSDHNVLNIAGFLLCVESVHSGKMLKRSEGGRYVY